MRRISLAAGCALALLAATTTLRAQPAAPQFAAKLSPAELKIETALAKPVKLSYRETPLKDVIADLAKQVDLAIELDPEGLEEADVTTAQLITLELGTLGLRQGLEVLLGPLHLDYIPYSSELMITSQEKCSEQPITRIYPVLDLISVKRPDASDLALDFDTLIDTITSHVSSDYWTDNGGSGQISGGPGGHLVVSQAHVLHRQVDLLLLALRQLHSDQAKLEADQFGAVIDLSSGSKSIREAFRKRDSTTLDIEFKFFVRDVAKVIEVPIAIDPEGMEEADVLPDQMVHVAYRDAVIGEAFRQRLSTLHLAPVIKQGYVVVTSEEKAAEIGLNTRIYPVGDLVPLRAIQDPPIRDFDSLIDLITSCSDHADKWAENGGSSSISGWPEPAALVITTTDDVHDDVEQLLTSLRESGIAEFNAEQAKADQRIVERVYPLYATRREKQAKAAKADKPVEEIPTADEVAKLIAELLPEVSFKEEGTLLRPFHDRLIVRHRPAMLHKIEKLLEKIDAWPPKGEAGQGAVGGGGFFSIERETK